MAEYTENYNLELPDENENYDVKKVNANNRKIDNVLGDKVDKEIGKGLSANDFTNAYKEKLDGLNNYDDTNLSSRVSTNETDISNIKQEQTTQNTNISNLQTGKANIAETGNKIDLEINNSTFKIKAKLYDKNNNLLSTSSEIDLPLESVVVNASYDSTNKLLILTLQNGNTTSVDVSDLISGLVDESTFNATVTVINQRIDELQTKVTDLENNRSTDTGSGTSIDLNDSADSEVVSIEMEGNSYQETTSISDGDEYDSPSPEHEQPINSCGDNGSITEKVVNENEFNPTPALNGYNVNANGIGTSTNFSISSKIKYNNSKKYYTLYNPKNTIPSGDFALRIGFFKEDETYISREIIELTANAQEISVPSNTSYMIIGAQTSTIWANAQNVYIGTSEIYQAHQEQTFTIPTQQPMRSIEDVRDCFFKNVVGSKYYDSTLVENKWYERHPINRYYFKGDENWTEIPTDKSDVYRYRMSMVGKINGIENIKSNYFKYNGDTNLYDGISGGFSSNAIIIRDDIKFTTINSLTQFLQEQYENGNPVYVDYILETPTILPCTPEQIEALEAFSKARTYKNVTHFSSEDEVEPFIEVEYVIDNETIQNGKMDKSSFIYDETTETLSIIL